MYRNFFPGHTDIQVEAFAKTIVDGQKSPADIQAELLQMLQ
jgi:hypothetical protein